MSKSIGGDGIITVNVQFIEGVKIIEETVRPSNLDGFNYWVKSRLEALNAVPAVQAALVDGTTVNTAEPVVIPPVLTQAQIDKNTWLDDYSKWVKVKSTLIDTGILTGNETPVVALKTKVQTNFKPGYVDSI